MYNNSNNNKRTYRLHALRVQAYKDRFYWGCGKFMADKCGQRYVNTYIYKVYLYKG